MPSARLRKPRKRWNHEEEGVADSDGSQRQDDVVPGMVKKTEGDSVYVQIDVEVEPGLADTIVVDVRTKDVFKSEPEALLAAVLKCQKSAQAGWSERASLPTAGVASFFSAGLQPVPPGAQVVRPGCD